MKLNELNQIEEGIVSSIKGMFTGQGGYQTQVQDIFIKDFVQDALTSLNNGVKGGLIDPNIKSTGTPAADSTPPSDGTTPEPEAAPEAPPEAGPAPTTPPSPKSGPTTPSPAPKPTPTPKAPKSGPTAPTPSPAPKPTPTPKAPKSGPTTPTPAPKPAPKSGPTTPTPAPPKPKVAPSTPEEVAKEKRRVEMLKLTGGKTLAKDKDGNFSVSTSDPSDPTSEYSVTYTFDKDYNLINTQSNKPSTTTESRYHKLNAIFESIVNIDEEDSQARTIADFMMDWFTQYMEGVNWKSSQAIVKQKLDKLQAEYPQNLKKNLTDLARMGLALSKTGTPAGAPEQFVQAQTQQQRTTTRTYRDIQDELEALAKTDPDAYNKLIKDLKPAPTRGFFYEDN